LGISDADHEETAPDAKTPIITKLSCSLRGLTQELRIFPKTVAGEAYRVETAMENFLCNYGVNPEFNNEITRGKLLVSGVGPDDEIRMVELPGMKFYVATLFVPQMISLPEKPHPLILAYLAACAKS
jgi:CTP synthase (UTP-ammonia lyase)